MLTMDRRIRLINQLSAVHGWRCWYCNTDLKLYYETRRKRHKVKAKKNKLSSEPLNARLHLDHVIPKVRGGSDRVDNLALACEFCNKAKSDVDLDYFLQWLDRVRFASTWTPVVDGRLNRAER